MKFFLRRFLFIVLLLLIIAGAVLYFVPLQDIAMKKIKTTLAEYNIKLNSLDIIQIDLEQAVISNINIGDERPLTVRNVETKYFYKEAIRGKLQSVDINGLEAVAYNKNNIWGIGGLEGLMKSKSEVAAKTAIDFAKLHDTLPAQINITESKVSLQNQDLQINVPFDLGLTNSAEKINGRITSKNITSSGLPYDIPPLDLQVEYTLGTNETSANFQAHSSKKDYQANINFLAPNADLMQGQVIINNISFPYGGGVVSAKAIQFPVDMKKPVNINLNLKNIDLATLLNKISGGQISGTGRISGAIPFTYYPDGHVTVRKGAVHTAKSGTIIVSPSLLPGDNPQLTIARKTLQNFHYTTLKIAVSSDKSNQLVITLSLEGNNPNENNGRMVKLNVNLSGDIISLIQQSFFAINDMKQLLNIKEVQ